VSRCPLTLTPRNKRDGAEAHKVDANTGSLSNTKNTSTVENGTVGTPSTGSTSSNTGDSGSSNLPGLSSGTGPGTGACDPAAYVGGYSDTLAVPSPCAPVKECGAYLGSVFVPEVCPADPADPTAPVAPVITTQMVSEAAKVTAPVNPPHVEPGTVSYVHVPNNYWADAPTVNDSVTLLGVTIPLRWTPTGTTWSFGDGATASGNGVEGADVGAAGAVEHAYGRQGGYAISTTTTYDLTFVLPGGGSQTIQLAAPPSPPVTLPIREIQSLAHYVS